MFMQFVRINPEMSLFNSLFISYFPNTHIVNFPEWKLGVNVLNTVINFPEVIHIIGEFK